MNKFFLASGLFLLALFLAFLRLSTTAFVRIMQPEGGLEGFVLIYFWFAGTVLSAIIGTIIMSLVAAWYKRKNKTKDSIFKMILISWFSFFAFLAILFVGFLGFVVLRLIINY